MKKKSMPILVLILNLIMRALRYSMKRGRIQPRIARMNTNEKISDYNIRDYSCNSWLKIRDLWS